MPLYTVPRTKHSASTSNDSLTIVSAAGKPLYIHIASVSGMGTASADNEIVLARSSGGTTGATPITPSPNDPGSLPASFSAYTAWTGQPTLGAVLWRFGVNANGGQDKAVTPPGMSFFIPAGQQVSFRSAAGTSPILINVQVEEIA